MTAFPALMVILGMELLALLALLGERQFALHEKIPVCWKRGFQPSLYAQRRVALSLFPLFGSVILLGMGFGRQPIYVLAVVQLALAAANLVYFRTIARSLREA